MTAKIDDLYYELRETIRQFLSVKLMDTDENHKMLVCIPLSFGAQGISTNDMITISAMYQDPKEGIILFYYAGCDADYQEFDDMFTEDLLTIVNYFKS